MPFSSQTNNSGNAAGGTCAVGRIAAEHAVALIQIMSNVLDEYQMRMITTKCLNTAVSLMYVMMGHQALEHTRYCDVPTVLERYGRADDYTQPRMAVVSQLKQRLLDAEEDRATRNRRLFYVLMTDADLPAVPAAGTAGTKYFPGHVFIVERSWKPGSDKPAYRLYQSYINKYKLGDKYAPSDRPVRSPQTLVKDLQDVLGERVWTKAKSVRAWTRLTGVDTSQLVGCETKNIALCFRDVSVDRCTEHLEEVVRTELKKLNLLERSGGAPPDAIWGQPSQQSGGFDDRPWGNPIHYGGSDHPPLSNREMKAELRTMQRKIRAASLAGSSNSVKGGRGGAQLVRVVVGGGGRGGRGGRASAR